MNDKDLILSLGGPTKVAVLLGFDVSKGGAQRVQNWMERGIPPKVKIDRPDLFLPDLAEKIRESDDSGHSRRSTDKAAP